MKETLYFTMLLLCSSLSPHNPPALFHTPEFFHWHAEKEEKKQVFTGGVKMSPKCSYWCWRKYLPGRLIKNMYGSGAECFQQKSIIVAVIDRKWSWNTTNTTINNNKLKSSLLTWTFRIPFITSVIPAVFMFNDGCPIITFYEQFMSIKRVKISYL